MTDLFALPSALDSASTIAARSILPILAGDGNVTRKDLNTAMVAALGGSDADGRWTQRDSFEMLEHAMALHLAGQPPVLEAASDVHAALALLARLPTQTVRSEDQVDWQQFSTPIDIAAVAVLLAAATPDDIVLEPSAGNGLLVAQLPAVAALHLNEIDPARRARLAATFRAAVPLPARWTS